MKWKNEKENLNYLINIEHLSYEEIGKRYGTDGSNVRKAASRLGLDLPKRREINPNEHFNRGTAKTAKCENCEKEFILYKGHGGKFCCNECQQEYRHKKAYNLILEGDASIMRSDYNIRIFKKDIINEQNGICAICGCKQEHNGKPLVFILDHIDGDASNNKRNNLRCICPNCDSQLETYKSKNKGKSTRTYLPYQASIKQRGLR